MESEFVTCLNCIDGRVQLPVINWIITNYDVKYVDMITTPGIDGLMADRGTNIKDILEKISISKKVHLTNQIFIVGHHDCLANPVKVDTHNQQIIDSVDRIKESYSTCNIIGLWVDSKFNVKVVYEL